MNGRPSERRSKRAGVLRGIGAAVLLAASLVPVAGVARSEAGTVPASESTRIITLGTLGGPVARGTRSGIASLLQVGDRTYLVDAGDGIPQRLAAAGFHPADIRKVFITHLHFDHVAGLAPLITFAWASMQLEGIDIYGPPGTVDFMAATRQYLTIPENIFARQMPPVPSIADLVKTHEFDIVKPTVIYSDDKVRVTAVANSHYDRMPGEPRPLGATRSYSYRFDTPDRSIVFTGDTGPSDAVIALAKGADVLVSEIIDVDTIMKNFMRDTPGATEEKLKSIEDHMAHHHLVPREVGRMATEAGVKMVLISHIGPADDDETDMRRYTDGVRETFAGPVIVAQDGGEY